MSRRRLIIFGPPQRLSEVPLEVPIYHTTPIAKPRIKNRNIPSRRALVPFQHPTLLMIARALARAKMGTSGIQESELKRSYALLRSLD